MISRLCLFVSLWAACITCSAADAVPSHAVAFIYHRIGDSRYPSTDTRTEQFKEQLDWLAGNSYQVWPLPRVVEYLGAGKPIPDRVVVITVDDAFQSFYENGYPLLKARGWPFTVFVSTDSVDGKLADFMSWDELRELAAHGGTLANHTADHGHLPFRQKGETDMAWADRVRTDIEKAQSRLQAELGRAANTQPKLFAYPYGEFSEELVKLVNGLGYVAFGQQAGAMGPTLDPRALPRFPINEHFGSVQEFALRASALPFPLRSVTPWEPMLRGNNPPLMRLELEPGRLPSGGLRCYLNGPPMEVKWLDEAKTAFSLQADGPLPPGRERYNCTAYVGGRYYWYSHMWLSGPPLD